jgi:hypothetical protein
VSHSGDAVAMLDKVQSGDGSLFGVLKHMVSN